MPSVLCAIALSATSAGAADMTKKECIDANVQGQPPPDSSQRTGKLRDAQAALRLALRLRVLLRCATTAGDASTSWTASYPL